MADEDQRGSRAASERERERNEREAGGDEPRDLREKILLEQTLVNERSDRPEQFGGMPTSPVETAEDASPPQQRETTPVDEIKPNTARRDIQSDGS